MMTIVESMPVKAFREVLLIFLNIHAIKILFYVPDEYLKESDSKYPTLWLFPVT